jgi:radical SAM-linked protein
MKAQRLRVTFARGDELKYITHLDLMRFWERALRRAALPVAYSEGFSPHAQISLAAPLAVGTTSGAELMDVFLSEPVPPRQFLKRLAEQLPPGLSLVSAQEAGLGMPALQAAVRFAEYEVDVDLAGAAVDVPAAVEAFLAAETIPWQHQREQEVRTYDIRAQVAALEAERADAASCRLRMRLKNDNTGSGRPEQVVAALGLPAPVRIHRTRLILEAASPAREAWRTRGRFAD